MTKGRTCANKKGKWSTFPLEIIITNYFLDSQSRITGIDKEMLYVYYTF